MFGFISRVDKVVWPLEGDLSADISSVSPLSERIKEFLVVCSLNSEQWGIMLLVGRW